MRDQFLWFFVLEDSSCPTSASSQNLAQTEVKFILVRGDLS